MLRLGPNSAKNYLTQTSVTFASLSLESDPSNALSLVTVLNNTQVWRFSQALNDSEGLNQTILYNITVNQTNKVAYMY
jgi:hypothetical protein